MSLDSFISGFNIIKDYDLAFSYTGKANDELTYNFIELSGHTYTIKKDLSKLKKKASFLLAECFQNIIRHSPELEKHDKKFKLSDQGVIRVVSKNNIGYYISGNFVKNEEISSITEKIEHINSLDKEGLKQFSVELLSNNDYTDKGGASLGLVDMARKSNHKLGYKFVEVNEKYSIFFLQITLISPEQCESNNIVIEDMLEQEYYNPQYALKSSIIYKGEVNSAVGNLLKELLQSEHIVSPSAKAQRLNIADTLIDVLAYSTTKGDVENLNVSGMFSLKVFDDKTTIRMGKIIQPISKDTIEKYTAKIEKYSSEELAEEHKKVIAMSDDIPYKKIYTGLCKMYLKYKDHFEYKIGHLDNGDVVYAIEITI